MTSLELAQMLRQAGIAHYTGVPCSMLQPLTDSLLDSRDSFYLGASDEGLAVAIATGFWLGGVPCGVLMQNSGLGNAVNPLTSLVQTFGVPLLLICSQRGGPNDEPQHRLMGQITLELLRLMEFETLSLYQEDLAERLALSSPRALVLQKGQLAPSIAGRRPSSPDPLVQSEYSLSESSLSRKERICYEVPRPDDLCSHNLSGHSVCSSELGRHDLSSTNVGSDLGRHNLASEDFCDRGESDPASQQRHHFLESLLGAVDPTAAVISTTGYASRELWAMQDRPSHFYMVGSMGCAAGVGLGVALAQPKRRVIVIDGDGALLMRMGILATVGAQGPANLTHLVLDNGMHESTGGQPTVTDRTDLPKVAAACGYARCTRVTRPQELATELSKSGPHLIHIPIVAGRPSTAGSLPRPTISPLQVARRFQEFLSGS